MAEVKKDKLTRGQVEEAEQDAKDPSHEKDPSERETKPDQPGVKRNNSVKSD